MGIFSKPKVPSFDINALNQQAIETANRRRSVLGGLKTNLAPITEQFKTGREALSARIPAETEANLDRFGQQLQGVGQADRAARTAANIAQREQSFRDVPELQRSIRESLGGSGLLQSGAARSTLARPIIDAATASRDFSNQNEVARLAGETARTQGFAETGFGARSQALRDRLGLDEETLKFLTESGRGDLINEANSLLGIEGDLGRSLESNEQLRQSQDIARAQASAARRGQIISSLGQFGGAALGFGLGGGPLGAAIGGQLGGAAGGFLGGTNPGGFDPTLLFALEQQRRRSPVQVTNPTTERFAQNFRTGG